MMIFCKEEEAWLLSKCSTVIILLLFLHLCLVDLKQKDLLLLNFVRLYYINSLFNRLLRRWNNIFS